MLNESPVIKESVNVYRRKVEGSLPPVCFVASIIMDLKAVPLAMFCMVDGLMESKSFWTVTLPHTALPTAAPVPFRNEVSAETPKENELSST